MLVSTEPIPATAESVRIDVDTMVIDTEMTAGAEAAKRITFGPPAVSSSGGFTQINVEVTNNDTKEHSFTVQALFMQGATLVGIGSGAVNDVAAGQTKTATLIVQGTAEGAEPQLLVDAVVE